jgi:hypothetical protein
LELMTIIRKDNNRYLINLKDALIRAWNNTDTCPDGVIAGAQFCPSCLYESLEKLLTEHAAITEALDYE